MRRLITILIIIFTLSCTKDTEIIVSIDDYLGQYCGSRTAADGWTNNQFSLEITKSDVNDQEVVFRMYSNDIKAIVNNDKLEIYEQSFEVWTPPPPWGGEPTLIQYTIKGEGVLHIENYNLKINYLLNDENYTLDIINWSKIGTIGNYVSDNSSVAITEDNDSLLISIVHITSNNPYIGDGIEVQWENIKAIDGKCYIHIHPQEVVELKSNKIHSIQGSIYKWADRKLEMRITEYDLSYYINYYLVVQKN